ncbi:MAG TPA: carboxypeptidase-like regulatory domain-containing protein [Kofleriaceae bacterium]|nr:carboxypeptidase-like regulatory domain-containing protein [Kofleriaceae bacterium]
MRAAAAVCALALLAATAEAGPEDAARLRAEGEAFARQRRYQEAVSAFKQADAAEPRGEHDCFIALAYRRLERWAQAEMFLARCRARLAPGEAAPSWTATLTTEIADGLKRTGHARVVIGVEPPEAAAAAQIAVSAFASDERFAPGAVYLPAGKHLVEVTATGFQSGSQTVVVEAGKETAVVVELSPPEPAVTPPPPPAEPAVVKPEVTATRRPMTVVERGSGLGWFCLGVGASAMVAGGIFNYLALHNQDLLARARTDADYEEHEARFDAQRIGTYVGYGIGAAGIAAGIYFLLKPQRQRTVWVSGSADETGARVFLEWRR